MWRKVAAKPERQFSSDLDDICKMICELATVEKRAGDASPDASRLRAALTGVAPNVHAYVLEIKGQASGYALVYPVFGSFSCRGRLHLEDLYLRQPARGLGFAYALMVEAAQLAVALDCSALEWDVRRDNSNALAYYERYQPTELDAWRHFEIRGEALFSLAAEGRV